MKPDRGNTARIFLGVSTAAVALAAPSMALAQTDGAIAGVEDIVVTAQKRSENLQNVPISITAISAETITSSRIQNVKDLASFAPNLVVTQSSGGSSIPNYTMRGVLAANASPGVDNGVSLYIDGVYIARNVGALLDVADIERIEVLKGPQGTLFGRNSTGGAISIITHMPTGEFSASQSISYGNYNHIRSKTRVDLPRFGPFEASFAYYHSERQGDIRNLGAGTTWDYGPATAGRFGRYTSPKRLGDNNTDGVQATVRFDSGGGFNAVYKFDYTDVRYTAPANAILAWGPAATGGDFAQLLYQLTPDQSLLSPITSKRPKAANNAFTTPGKIRNYGHTLTATYEINDVFTVKNLLAYRNNKIDDTNQIDGAGGIVDSLGLLCAGAGAPVSLLGINNRQRENQWSNELQLNATTDFFDLTAGLFWFRHRVTSGGKGLNQVQLFAPTPGYVVVGPLVPPSQLRAKSTAFFIQSAFHLTDQVDLVGGIRLTKDKKRGVDTTSVIPLSFAYDNDKPTWLLGLNYQVTPNILTYIKANTGYISGGQIGGNSYDPETALSFEGGIKADLFDRRLRTNLAIFHVTYRGLQFPTLINGIQSYKNAGKSRAWGGELEVSAVPVEGLTLQGNVGYTNFKYLSLDFAAVGLPPTASIDDFLPTIRPKITSSVSAQYETAPLSFGRLTARAELRYHSAYDTQNIVAPEVLDALRAPKTLLVNGRVGVTEIELGNVKADVSLWGKNLTNNRALAFSAALGFIYSGNYEPARTYGIDVNFQF